MTVLLELNNICKNYKLGNQKIHILKNINLEIQSGEMIAIMGASGSGKSTLMNILGCLDTASSGIYQVNKQDISIFNNDNLAKLRREYFGFIFQRYHLLPYVNVINNVEIPAIYSGISKIERRKRAIFLLKKLGLSERINYWPNQLSGGQQQRVSIARALMNGGQVILADEPAGALDSYSSNEVINILKKLCEKGHTVIIVTHDSMVANQVKRVIKICDGKIISDIFKHKIVKNKINFLNSDIRTTLWKQIITQFYEAFIMALRAIKSHKIRSALTMLGIIIGILSVVLILVIGDAAKNKVLEDIKSIGTNTIDIYPGQDFINDNPIFYQSLKYEDLIALKEQSYVNVLTPIISRNMQLRIGNIDVLANVNGIGEHFFNVYDMIFLQGSAINIMQSQSQIVVIDINTQHKFFPNKKHVIGEVIMVGNMPLTIIGVVKQKKSMLGNHKTLNVWIPYNIMINRIVGNTYFDSITLRIKDGYNSQEVEKKLINFLILRHGKKDFFIYNMDSLVHVAEKTTRTLQIFLMLIAIISLVVGGIGVMNIMLVSVTERTREIGILMAVGARSSNVLQQFLIEAILICLFGGILGVFIALLISFSLQWFLIGDWKITCQPIAIISGIICSTIIGMIFGYLPARHAANLSPVDALSRE